VDVTQSDTGMRNRRIPDLEGTTYGYDINGDGTDEAIPFYTRPNGSSVINNTITRVCSRRSPRRARRGRSAYPGSSPEIPMETS